MYDESQHTFYFNNEVIEPRGKYWYDAHGNTLTMSHLSEMIWDYADRLVKTSNGTYDTWYRYNLQGERVRKVSEKSGGIVEDRKYIPGYELYKKSINGDPETERQTLNILDIKMPEKSGEEDQEPQKMTFDNNKKIVIIETQTLDEGEQVNDPEMLQRYQFSNHLGSACLELDDEADIISYEEYHPFGTTSFRSGRSETEVSLKRYKYIGKERDEESGLYYYGARYYAAWLCRFVSVDPLQHKYPHYTPYQYAGNKPISFIDLDGLEECFPRYGYNRIYDYTEAKAQYRQNKATYSFTPPPRRKEIVSEGFEYLLTRDNPRELNPQISLNNRLGEAFHILVKALGEARRYAELFKSANIEIMKTEYNYTAQRLGFRDSLNLALTFKNKNEEEQFNSMQKTYETLFNEKLNAKLAGLTPPSLPPSNSSAEEQYMYSLLSKEYINQINAAKLSVQLEMGPSPREAIINELMQNVKLSSTEGVWQDVPVIKQKYDE